MTLSVCCATGDPAPQVASMLAPLRGIADEIVVAYDARVAPESLGPVARLADRLVRFEFDDYVEQALAWLHSLCGGEWILRLDGDEVVSRNLLMLLPELIADTRMQQYWVGYRWLYPDAEHWLAEPPWLFDTNRLVRNDPASLWFPGLCHTVADAAFPSGYPDAALYHLSWLMASPVDLRAKVERYLRMPSGHAPEVIEQDVPAFYRPDSARHSNPVPVPPEDRALIHAVLKARGKGPPRLAHVEVPLVTRAEVRRHWAHRPLSAQAYRARVEPLVREVTIEHGEQRTVLVRVHNDGHEAWPGGEHRRPLIRLSYYWVQPGDEREEGPRTMLPAPLAPGQAAIVPATVAAPDRPGRHWLCFDLVHEFERWFACPSPHLLVKVPAPAKTNRRRRLLRR
jgi:hypothetical protein